MASADAWTFFREVLGSPRYVAAPMVRASDLAFRLQVRAYGVELAYTPMLRADRLIAGCEEEAQILGELAQPITSASPDHPLVLQLAGRDPEVLAEACSVALRDCGQAISAIDLNLGCPQDCAVREGFGAQLLAEPEVACACVRSLVAAVAMASGSVPKPAARQIVCCKIRVLPNDPLGKSTADLARRLEGAGCMMLAVHGRTPSAKFDGPVNVDAMRTICKAVRVPVLVNGGVRCRDSANSLLAETGAAGVMVGTALLSNPWLFSQEHHSPDPIGAGLEYLALAAQYPPPGPDRGAEVVRRHLRWILRPWLPNVPEHFDLWSLLRHSALQGPWRYEQVLRLAAARAGLSANRCWPCGEDRLPSLGEVRRGALDQATTTSDDQEDDFCWELPAWDADGFARTCVTAT